MADMDVIFSPQRPQQGASKIPAQYIPSRGNETYQQQQQQTGGNGNNATLSVLEQLLAQQLSGNASNGMSQQTTQGGPDYAQPTITSRIANAHTLSQQQAIAAVGGGTAQGMRRTFMYDAALNGQGVFGPNNSGSQSPNNSPRRGGNGGASPSPIRNRPAAGVNNNASAHTDNASSNAFNNTQQQQQRYQHQPQQQSSSSAAAAPSSSATNIPSQYTQSKSVFDRIYERIVNGETPPPQHEQQQQHQQGGDVYGADNGYGDEYEDGNDDGDYYSSGNNERYDRHQSGTGPNNRRTRSAAGRTQQQPPASSQGVKAPFRVTNRATFQRPAQQHAGSGRTSPPRPSSPLARSSGGVGFGNSASDAADVGNRPRYLDPTATFTNKAVKGAPQISAATSRRIAVEDAIANAYDAVVTPDGGGYTACGNKTPRSGGGASSNQQHGNNQQQQQTSSRRPQQHQHQQPSRNSRFAGYDSDEGSAAEIENVVMISPRRGNGSNPLTPRNSTNNLKRGMGASASSSANVVPAGSGRGGAPPQQQQQVMPVSASASMTGTPSAATNTNNRPVVLSHRQQERQQLVQQLQEQRQRAEEQELLESHIIKSYLPPLRKGGDAATKGNANGLVNATPLQQQDRTPAPSPSQPPAATPLQAVTQQQPQQQEYSPAPVNNTNVIADALVGANGQSYQNQLQELEASLSTQAAANQLTASMLTGPLRHLSRQQLAEQLANYATSYVTERDAHEVLKARVAELSRIADTTTNLAEESDRNCKQLLRKLDASSNELADVKARLEAAETEKFRLQRELDTQTARANDGENRVMLLRQSNNSLEEVLYPLQKEHERLKLQQEGHQQDLLAMETKHELGIQTLNVRHQAEVEHLKLSVQKLEREARELKDGLADLESLHQRDRKESANKLNDAYADVDKAKALTETVRSELRALAEAAENERNNHSRQEQVYLTEVETLKSRITALNGQYDQTFARKNELEREMVALRDAHNAMTVKVKMTLAELESTDAERESRRMLERQNLEMEKQLLDLRATLNTFMATRR